MPLFPGSSNGRTMFGRSSNTNPFWSSAGQAAGLAEGFNPMGLIDGSLEGIPNFRALLSGDWVKTLDSGTITPTAGAPQTIKLVTAASANTGPQMQWSYDGGTTAFAQFIKDTTQPFYAKCQVKLSDATASSFFFGLATATTTIFHTDSTLAGTGLTNAVGFYKTAGATSLNGILRAASTTTSQTLTGYAAANDTYQTLEVLWLGGTSVIFGVDGVRAYTQTTLTNEPTGAMALSVALDATAAAAKTATISRLCAWQQKLAA